MRYSVFHLFLFIILIHSCSETKNTKFVKAYQYTEVDKDNGLHEVFVVIDPPDNRSDLLKLIKVFQKNVGRDTNYFSHNRLYIRLHEKSIQDRLENNKTDYLSGKKVPLDDDDFLYSVLWYRNPNNNKLSESYTSW